ncbi:MULTISPECIES: hypothetical protein [unclassified Haloarcula]|nr:MULTISPECIES: hypothetical protein [unclassified Haloarcula]
MSTHHLRRPAYLHGHPQPVAQPLEASTASATTVPLPPAERDR